MTVSGPLLLIGCGKMGGAMLRGWLRQGVRGADVTVVEPNPNAVADPLARALSISTLFLLGMPFAIVASVGGWIFFSMRADARSEGPA